MSERDFEALGRLSVDSYLWRLAAGSGRALRAAWDDSRTGALVRRAGALIEGLPTAERLRASAICAAAMSAGYLAYLRIAPAYVAPGIPRAWIVTGMVVALAVAVLAVPMATAWTDSSLAAVVRRRR